jgi:hypothetical protein
MPFSYDPQIAAAFKAMAGDATGPPPKVPVSPSMFERMIVEFKDH